MYIALVTIYVVICFFLILVVLLQQGKGADIAGAFGGGSSQTAFGARGATTFLHKLTTGAFIGFVAIALLLSILEARPKSSVISKSLPAAPAKAAPAPAAQPPAGQAAPGQPAAGQAPVQPAPAQPAPAAPSSNPSKP
ncbi:MAG TPA: preprotein translocase subunit SecG [Thermoanaerobaculia bacterium]|nr:preprotein translocase subunit SecG [Thermoanaerobaculia bacterium]